MAASGTALSRDRWPGPTPPTPPMHVEVSSSARSETGELALIGLMRATHTVPDGVRMTGPSP